MSSSSDRDEKASSQPDPVAAEVRKDKKTSRGWEFMFFFTEAGLIALYVIFSTYADGQAISSALNEEDYARDNAQATKTMQEVFPMWTDINVMVFVGFGFLKVFLKTNSLTAISFNLLIGAFAMQWGILCYAFWEMLLNQQDWRKVEIDIQHLIVGSQGAAAALISLGALIGKITYVQAYILVFFEMIFYGLLRVIILDLLQAVDVGGSMTVHMFGAYFGLACAFFFKPKRAIEDYYEQGVGHYNSYLIGMLGTLFLFIYWPSFNSALSTGVNQQRAALNTFYAITASALMAAFISRFVNKHRFDMQIVMNATLSGGVMIASSCEMIFNPGWAILVGGFAGIASSLAYRKLPDFYSNKVKLHDTCGIQYLHGIPGQLGAVTSAVCAGLSVYNYPNSFLLEKAYPQINGRDQGRTASEQAWIQMAAYGMVFFGSCFAGSLSGFLSNLAPHPIHIFDDIYMISGITYGDKNDEFNEATESELSAHQPVPDTETNQQEKEIEMEFRDDLRERSVNRSLQRGPPNMSQSSISRNSQQENRQ